jgi:hypothetical protein
LKIHCICHAFGFGDGYANPRHGWQLGVCGELAVSSIALLAGDGVLFDLAAWRLASSTPMRQRAIENGHGPGCTDV